MSESDRGRLSAHRDLWCQKIVTDRSDLPEAPSSSAPTRRKRIFLDLIPRPFNYAALPSRVTRSALAGDLARLRTGAPGGWPALAARAPGADRCGAEPVRRAAETGRAPTPPWPGGPKSGRRRPGAQRFPERLAMTGGSCAALPSAQFFARAYQDQRPTWTGALRAPLKT